MDDMDDNVNSVPANLVSVMKGIYEKFSNVSTSSDDTYFYVASNGLPSHNMMVGITNWQQQVPIDHDYTGSNSWAIPIQPELSDNPLSTKTNLLKGAIAIAVNGIPIFNPLNNRGEDANDIGELDQWGGHCGRADDYHYHIPPTHLQSTVGAGNPIAYAVDGFPVYGETNETLDESLGRFNADGSYQYHTISTYPYFIAAMRGKVNLDPNTSAPENQVIPQASTQGVRPALTPLQGAAITGFESTGTNQYSLTYTLNSQNYMVHYGWDDSGKYTYEFVNPDGSSSTENYNR
ncbi:MAG: YHYH protein [Cyclobacteriaceae bacterium]